MQILLKSIERIGREYGLKLNKGKCVAIRYDGGKPIKVADNTNLQTKEQATHTWVIGNSEKGWASVGTRSVG